VNDYGLGRANDQESADSMVVAYAYWFLSTGTAESVSLPFRYVGLSGGLVCDGEVVVSCQGAVS